MRDLTIPLLITSAVAIIVWIGKLVFRPVEPHIKDTLDIFQKGQEACRIYVFGLPGAGKTTLMKSVLTRGNLEREESTEKFHYLRASVPLNEMGTIVSVPVLIGDYKGQNPSEVTINCPSGFAGSPGDRVINAIYFVVDIVPRKHDAESGK